MVHRQGLSGKICRGWGRKEEDKNNNPGDPDPAHYWLASMPYIPRKACSTCVVCLAWWWGRERLPKAPALRRRLRQRKPIVLQVQTNKLDPPSPQGACFHVSTAWRSRNPRTVCPIYHGLWLLGASCFEAQSAALVNLLTLPPPHTNLLVCLSSLDTSFSL